MSENETSKKLTAKDNLFATLMQAKSQKKHVTLVLNSGKEYSCFLSDVSEQAITFTNEAKNYYDVFVETKNIVAVEIKMKG